MAFGLGRSNLMGHQLSEHMGEGNLIFDTTRTIGALYVSDEWSVGQSVVLQPGFRLQVSDSFDPVPLVGAALEGPRDFRKGLCAVLSLLALTYEHFGIHNVEFLIDGGRRPRRIVGGRGLA